MALEVQPGAMRGRGAVAGEEVAEEGEDCCADRFAGDEAAKWLSADSREGVWGLTYRRG